MKKAAKHLLLFRHAKSSWEDTGLADANRPLNERGKRDAPRMGAFLAKIEMRPDRILCSPAQRAKQTAQEAAKSCGYSKKIRYIDSLYEGSSKSYWHAIRKYGGKSGILMIVGHNPDLEEFLLELTGQQKRLPTSAIACIQLNLQTWTSLRLSTKTELVELWTVKNLPKFPRKY